MPPKKIALCISGEPRSSMFCFSYIFEAFLKPSSNYIVDVYIHSFKNYRALSLYNPKKFLIEDIDNDLAIQGLHKFKTINKKIHFVNKWTNGLNMFYGIKKCWDLIEEKYDFYIRIRPDLFFNYPLKIDTLIKNLLNQNVDLLILHNELDEKNGNKINDQFAIGTYKGMEVYCNTFNNLFSIVEELGVWYNEKILETYLQKFKINYNLFSSPHLLVRKSKVFTNDHYFNEFLDT